MKKKTIIIIVAVFIALGAVACVGGYLLALRKNDSGEIAKNTEEISMVGWKEYSNSRYGYKIKYPVGWELKGNSVSEAVELASPSDSPEEEILDSSGKTSCGIEIQTKENKKSLSSRSWIIENLSADSYERRNLRDEKYGENPATKIINFKDTDFAVYFARESSIYELLVYEGEYHAEIEAIIKSFEFTSAISKEYKIYTVKEGETLSYVASKFNIAWPKLAKYNKIKSPDQVYTGQKLKIPLDPTSVTTTSDTNSVDMDLAKTYQNQVDAGREVWRLDPLEVAKREIPPQKDILESDSFRVVTEDRLAGIITIEITKSNGEKYEAVLVQPVRRGSGGIWVVKSLKIK
jgi:LysM repeat protein